MKKRISSLLAGALLLLCSCIPSLNPFYRAQDVVWDDRLAGEWQKNDADEPEIWKFEPGDNKSYKLTVTENGKEGVFAARLFALKNEYFLDLIPTDCDYATNQVDLVAFSMYPGHLLVHVPELGPELKLAFFDFDWLEKHLDENPDALAHHREEKRIILTAETSDLQTFVEKNLANGLFGKPGELVRRTNSVSSTPSAPH